MPAMSRSALNAQPRETYVAPFGYVTIFETAAEIAAIDPDMGLVAALTAAPSSLPHRATIAISSSAFSRRPSGFRKILSAEPLIASSRPIGRSDLGKAEFHSRHLSKRGGDLWCTESRERTWRLQARAFKHSKPRSISQLMLFAMNVNRVKAQKPIDILNSPCNIL